MWHFESPWFFLLLAAIPLIALLRYRRRHKNHATLAYPTLEHVRSAGRSLRMSTAWLPLALRCLALVSLCIALARPQYGQEVVRDASKGVAMEMVVDRSSSMGAELAYKGEKLTRLDLVKRVFKDFVFGNDSELSGRPNDLIGMIGFARYPTTVCPLTLAHDVLPKFLDTLEIVKRKNRDGTAIGDAIALAVARLDKVAETLKKQHVNEKQRYEIKSKVIILLSDGRNNYGEYSPMEAAKFAEEKGVRIHTIAMGGGEAVKTVQTPMGKFRMPAGQSVDTSMLRSVAEETGGRFFEANNVEALREIYSEIDDMEKTEIEAVRYVDYREMFTPLALAALSLIVLEVLLRSTLYRRIP